MDETTRPVELILSSITTHTENSFEWAAGAGVLRFRQKKVVVIDKSSPAKRPLPSTLANLFITGSLTG